MKNLKEKINIILEDLYQIDSSFKNYEKDLRQLIKNLLELKPQAELDEEFRQELKAKILNRIEELKAKKQTNRTSFLSKLHLIRLPAYAALGVSVIILALLVGTVYYKGQSLFEGEKISLIKGIKINPLSNNRAFGSLEDSDSQTLKQQEEAAEMNAPQGLGTGPGSLADKPVEVEIAPYRPIDYKYVYEGELNLDGDYVKVLQRSIENNLGSFNNIINRFNLGLMDLNKFSDISFKTIRLEEDSEAGYNVSINLDQGMISIYKNWSNWPTVQESSEVISKDISQSKPAFNSNNIPNDSTLIDIANHFCKRYKIDLTPYGEPEVYQEREFLIQREAEAENFIPAPSNIRLIYPLLIEGKRVYTTSGEIFGLDISIDIAKKKVSGLYNLTVHQYYESNYDMASEKDVLSYLEEGATQGHVYYRDDQRKKVTVKLEEPTMGYVKYWQHSKNRGEMPQEILVPALIFSIQEKPADAVYNFRDKIVVPLAKDLIENINSKPIPVPMIDIEE
jgi:hypothetical protein